MDRAQEFAGSEMFVPEDQLPKGGKEDFFLFQLSGCLVRTRKGEPVGTVKKIEVIQGNDLLVVEREGREILIPFAGSICVEIDLDAKEIVIAPPEGLLDLNEI